MTAENSEPETPVAEDGDTPLAPMLPETTPLNRAERRAQAKGKKGPVSGGSTFGSQGNVRGPQSFGGGNVGKTRLPRTGHK